MEHSLLKELNLEGKSFPLCLGWAADHQRQETNSGILVLGISGAHDTIKHWIPKVHTVNSLALPQQTRKEIVLQYPYLQDLPVNSYRNVRPQMLIGIDNYRLGLALDSREGRQKESIATRTRLAEVSNLSWQKYRSRRFGITSTVGTLRN